MKRAELAIVTILVVVIMSVVSVVSWNCMMYYTKEAKVIEVSDNIVSVVDKINEVWQFEADGEAYKIGDKVSMKMDTMGSDFNIYDDRIVDVKLIK